MLLSLIMNIFKLQGNSSIEIVLEIKIYNCVEWLIML